MKLLGIDVCTPAVVYLVISILLILYVLFSLTNVMGFSVWVWALIHVLIILFWTFILNAVCAYGYSWVSWILVLFPLLVVLLGILTNAY
jgi:hypothetical protein